MSIKNDHSVSPEDIAFVTTSTGSVWESFSQALLASRFPESRRIVIDGRKQWSPLGFLEPSLFQDEQIIVLVDEDCFVFDREQLLNLASRLVREQNAVFLGTPDGGTFHRDHNPFACNTFFLMIKRRALLELIEADSNWRELTFSEVPKRYTLELLPGLDSNRVQHDEFEPYYPMFWLVLASGKEVLYEIPAVDTELFCSSVRLDGYKDDLLKHMWWLREWKDTRTNAYLGIDHATRYARLRGLLASKYFSSMKMRILFVKMELGRRYRLLRSRVQLG